jgi:AcrR family transcriptional regulator
MKSIKDIPLQQRKQARTRLALLDATIELMREKALADITVEEICQEVEVSKGTFFRYFPQKVDLLFYYIRLWNIEVVWHTNRIAGSASGIAVIEAIFELTAEVFKDHPRIFLELIALRAFEQQKFVKSIQSHKRMVSQAERLLRFPDMEGIDLIPHRTLYRIIQDSLKDAIANKEIPKNIDIEDVSLSLGGIFYGVPLLIANQNTLNNLASAYKKQLHILWAGLRHTDWKGKIFHE